VVFPVVVVYVFNVPAAGLSFFYDNEQWSSTIPASVTNLNILSIYSAGMCAVW